MGKTSLYLDLNFIRKLTMMSLFADDDLLEYLVLKGGNVLTLLYDMTYRASLDIDASLRADFPWPILTTEQKLNVAFERVFNLQGLEVFDAKLESKPKNTDNKKFSGYEYRFKVIPLDQVNNFKNREARKSVEALVVGPNQQRTFTVDFSLYEYILNPKEFDINGYTIYAYSPEMIGVEKLRAICQQFPEYQGRKWPTPRSRDFFDIYYLSQKLKVDFMSEEVLTLIPEVFKAKDVPLNYLERISELYNFHKQDFSALKDSVPASIKVEDYDFYFSFVEQLATKIYRIFT